MYFDHSSAHDTQFTNTYLTWSPSAYLSMNVSTSSNALSLWFCSVYYLSCSIYDRPSLFLSHTLSISISLFVSSLSLSLSLFPLSLSLSLSLSLCLSLSLSLSLYLFLSLFLSLLVLFLFLSLTLSSLSFSHTIFLCPFLLVSLQPTDLRSQLPAALPAAFSIDPGVSLPQFHRAIDGIFSDAARIYVQELMDEKTETITARVRAKLDAKLAASLTVALHNIP
jgi:hypothetical protein